LGWGLVPHFLMTYKDIDPPNWRHDPGLKSKSEYRKRFAFRPVVCSDGTKVWFKSYYKKYEQWSHGDGASYYDEGYLHTDFIENVTEADFIIRKLAETL
jgi:hypothetical protein